MSKILKYIAVLCTLLSFVSSYTFAQDSIDTISIISFNDFHGKFIPDKGVPGAAALVGSINALRKSSPNPIVVSGGDNFSGDFFSRITRGNLIKEMFSRMNVELSAVGNHEFDWGIPFLKDTMAVDVPLVSANIINDKEDSPSWLKPYRVIERTLRDGKPFRIAFIGLTTVTSAQKNKSQNLAGIHFSDPVGAVERQMLSGIRRDGRIDMVVIVMHIGTDMAYPYRIAERNSEMLPFVPGIFAIISAHTHKVVLDKINNVPVIQAGCYGRDIGILYFQVRNHNGIRDISFITADTLQTKKNVVDMEMQHAIDKEADNHGFYEKLTYSKDLMIHDASINYFSYTAPGAYVSASYAYAYTKAYPNVACPVIGVNHFRGIRSNIYKGVVTYLNAANLLPFGGNVVAYRFTGASLAKLLTNGRHNKAGYLQTAGIKIQVNRNNVVQRIWYKNKEIGKRDSCIVVLDSYIADGSDGYDTALFTHPLETLGTTTDLFTGYLRTLSFISLKKAPLPVVIKEE